MKRLSDAEQDIMMYIWQNHHEVTSDEIVEGLHYRWKKTSVLTFLSRLTEKEYLKCRKDGKKNYYEPAVAYEVFAREEGRTILGKLYQNSVKNFVAALYDGQELDRKELEELKQYLVSLEDTPEKSRKEPRLWKRDIEK